MSTFKYMRSGEALNKAADSARDFEKIKGRRAASAERFLTHIQGGSRTKAGYLREPNDPWRAHAYVDTLFKTIERIEVAKDAERGMIEVFFTDGSSDLVDRYGFLCVEFKTGE
jgi:hypothetical protein